MLSNISTNDKSCKFYEDYFNIYIYHETYSAIHFSIVTENMKIKHIKMI